MTPFPHLPSKPTRTTSDDDVYLTTTTSEVTFFGPPVLICENGYFCVPGRIIYIDYGQIKKNSTKLVSSTVKSKAIR